MVSMFDILDMMDTMTWLHVEYVGHDGLLVDMVDLLEMAIGHVAWRTGKC